MQIRCLLFIILNDDTHVTGDTSGVRCVLCLEQNPLLA